MVKQSSNQRLSKLKQVRNIDTGIYEGPLDLDVRAIQQRRFDK